MTVADSVAIVQVGPVDNDSDAVIVRVITSPILAYAVLELSEAIAIVRVGLVLSTVIVEPDVICCSVRSTNALGFVVVSSFTLISKSKAPFATVPARVIVAVHSVVDEQLSVMSPAVSPSSSTTTKDPEFIGSLNTIVMVIVSPALAFEVVTPLLETTVKVVRVGAVVSTWSSPVEVSAFELPALSVAVATT